jgi:predicted Fe-Mo cluster-binding NifX family protein
MRIAVASDGKDKGSGVSQVAGRSPHYLIFEEGGKLLETVKNPFAVGGGGAGWGVAKMLADRKVDVVAAGRFGPNMVQALEQRGMKHVECSGAAEEAARKAAGGQE